MHGERIKKIGKQARTFCIAHEQKIITVIALILVAALSFEAGIIHGKKWAQKPLIIEKSPPPPIVNASTDQAKENTSPQVKQNTATQQDVASCVYVGSKNSNKYYPPSCSFAKRIKPENLRCFASDEEARQQGYQRSTAC